MSDTSSGLARTTRILRFLLKYRGAGVFTGLDFDFVPDGGTPEITGKPEEFVVDLEALGPTFIKFGQALSTRPDLVPPAYLAALERTQDHVAPVQIEHIRAVLEAELGVRPSHLFEAFDEVPLGSASLAQVHRATLRDGRDVAVKVQRPGIRKLIHTDLDALATIASRADMATRVGRRVHFADWVHEFRKALLSELDYHSEAENLSRFRRHFRDYPELFVPAPLWDFSTRHVLTMELVTGYKVTELSGLFRTEHDVRDLAEALLRGYLDQVLVHGDIHADPHPGNLLVMEDGRLALFDLGMVVHVPPRQRDRLFRLLFAAVDGRGEEVAREAVGMGIRLEDFEADRYQREVGQLVARYAAHPSASASESRLLFDIVRISTACGLRSPSELSLLGKTLAHLETVCRALDPRMDMKRVVDRHLDRVMGERLRQSLAPHRVASELMDLQTLTREAPRKLSDMLSLLADNRFQIRVSGLEESRLMENMQKIANRITTGLIVAALIIAAAMIMRIETEYRLFGYPALALVLFVVAAGLGISIVLSALLRDRRARPREESGPR
ncbi:putative unusual protein kinase regulating ubiquinone biosynthesis (AarF/ABC1/UbiB family) [Lysobacter niabensis]|uniref:Unusual protein kinase regulating ubiquinone biosynthesis (AarF/ABC1/UbiB family) n=1 Tax=Agrilutibacter niabensis TaxID=380628 RepID=A0ABU1VLM6_9GAMM|nr:AarF/UbiB family protein [Lysobacter niabensis]MDR7098240.1 putative unusual protein kinase regulating ubiquinone biosynthesis (AarF/ABC1/UbiB family) [Lysobacter niabensis]